MKKDFVIRILFVEHLVDEAEQIISLLRNTGIAVRPARAVDNAQVQAALVELEPDLVLFDPANGSIALPDVVKLLDATGRDYALLGLVGTLDNRTGAELFEQGVHGIGARSLPGQLLSVIKREFDALQTRRQVRRLEAMQHELERRCEALLDSSRDAIAYVHEGVHVRANQAYLDTFGYTEFDDLLGLTILDMIDPADVDSFKALLRGQDKQEKPPGPVSLRARRADGGTFAAMVDFASATFEGEPCLQLVFREQAVAPAVLEQLKRDQVTGLYTRAHLLERIEDAVHAAAAGAKGHSLLLIVPDNWPAIAATVGLGKADELVAGLAGRVRSLLGEQDDAGVLAEHTFGILLSPRSDDAIRDWMNQLHTAVNGAIFDAGNRSISITVSIGGCLMGEKNANTDLLLDQASHALRAAIDQGGNTTELHDPSAREKADAKRELAWLELVKRSLADNSLLLYHQQTVSLQDADGDYSEILLRMSGPQGEVMPGVFLPIADKHGLSTAIDRWVLGHAFDALRRRERQGAHTTYFVKLTTASLQDSSLVPWLAEQIRQTGMKRGRLVLEATESKVMTLLRPAQEFVTQWKRLGGLFALEQFGSGLNSFQLLAHVDADFLKLDRSYMADLPHHPENQKKIAELCAQAHELKKQVITEWVEDATSTSLLFAAGVDFVQGHFLQVPQRLD